MCVVWYVCGLLSFVVWCLLCAVRCSLCLLCLVFVACCVLCVVFVVPCLPLVCFHCLRDVCCSRLMFVVCCLFVGLLFAVRCFVLIVC